MVGFGFDVHRLASGESLILGGVRIESAIGTVAHSDGDVLYHALCDALLGAVGFGDIGELFPDTDAENKNRNSAEFVVAVREKLTKHNYSIINVDIALTLEKPKILPYKHQMKQNISDLLGIDVARVNVKATTNEKLGYVGRGEGVNCFAVCEVQAARVE